MNSIAVKHLRFTILGDPSETLGSYIWSNEWNLSISKLGIYLVILSNSYQFSLILKYVACRRFA